MNSRDNQFGNGNGAGQFMFPGMGMGGMPILIRPEAQQQPQEPPLRAQMAMSLVSLLTRKTAAQAAANENHIEVIPGQKLTDEEEGALATGMNALSCYFANKLEPDVWERQTLINGNGIPTMQCRCICLRSDVGPNPDCPFCAGEGTMDIVVRAPRKVRMDADGNVIVGNMLTNTGIKKEVHPGITPPTPRQGRKPRQDPSNPE